MSTVLIVLSMALLGIVSMCVTLFVVSRFIGGVRRQNSRTFDSPLPALIATVGKVLAQGGQGYRYTKTTVSEDRLLATTRIKPDSWPLLLSTAMIVELGTVGDKCLLTVTTQSQKWIAGDAFGFYDGYITQFLDSVSVHVKEEESSSSQGQDLS